MSSWVEATKSYVDNVDHRDCPNPKCGAALAVTVLKQAGHNDREECNCPACGQEMIYRASQTPNVRLR